MNDDYFLQIKNPYVSAILTIYLRNQNYFHLERFDSFFLANRLELLKSLYNLNTKSNTLMPSLKITLYNKMQQKGNAIRIIGKEF